MNARSPLLVDPPELSDEMASVFLDFLYELTTAFENHYANQLRRYHHSTELPHPDLFEDIDDQAPPF